jgi:hypothetical protein
MGDDVRMSGIGYERPPNVVLGGPDLIAVPRLETPPARHWLTLLRSLWRFVPGIGRRVEPRRASRWERGDARDDGDQDGRKDEAA